MKNKNIYLLQFLMVNSTEKCPPKKFFPSKEEELLAITTKNKAIPFLFHFLNCPSCKKKIKASTLKKLLDYQKFALIWPLLYQKEKQNIGEFCQKEKIKIVLMKDLSSYSKMSFHQQFLMGVDIDLLIKEKNLNEIELFLKKKGYKLKKYLKIKDEKGKVYYQEKNFFHPKKQTSIDLHFQLAIPHKDEFDFLSKKTIEKITKEIFNHSTQQKNKLARPKKEYFLFGLIIHYIGSDLIKGLRSLFDIIQFAHSYSKEINWKNFLSLTERFKLTNFCIFILLLGSQTFNIPYPEEFKEEISIPLKVKFLTNYWILEKIAVFPLAKDWHNKNREAKKIFYENFFIKLILSHSISIKRLIRPRILIFIIKNSLRGLKKFISFHIKNFFYRKPLHINSGKV